VRSGVVGLVLSILAVGLFVASFEWMWKMGERLARRSLPMVVPQASPAVALQSE